MESWAVEHVAWFQYQRQRPQQVSKVLAGCKGIPRGGYRASQMSARTFQGGDTGQACAVKTGLGWGASQCCTGWSVSWCWPVPHPRDQCPSPSHQPVARVKPSQPSLQYCLQACSLQLVHSRRWWMTGISSRPLFTTSASSRYLHTRRMNLHSGEQWVLQAN